MISIKVRSGQTEKEMSARKTLAILKSTADRSRGTESGRELQSEQPEQPKNSRVRVAGSLWG